MTSKRETKAVFRWLLAYSDGHRVSTFAVERDLMYPGIAATAVANDGSALTVALARSAGQPHSGADDSESLAAAYEIFLHDGDLCGDEIEWVRLG